MANITFDTNFYIVVFYNAAGKQILLFAVFFISYLVCLLWNMMIIAVIYMDSGLKTPMYFFLCNLSLVDVLYASVTLPKLLDIILTGDNRLSFTACFAQLYFFTSMACTEIILLTVMAYDRYVAICNPLHYPLVMKRKTCILLVGCSWTSGCCNSVFVTIFSSYLSFCASKNINQLFCDVKALTKISCGDTEGFQVMIFVEALLMGLCPFLLILMSYTKIVSNILVIHALSKRYKAFSTCTSHLSVLLIFYGTLLFMYMRPPLENSEELDQIFSVFYLAVTPTLNPLIYSLRNQQIKTALIKILKL